MPSSSERYIRWMRLSGMRQPTINSRRRLLVRLEAFLGMPLLEATTDDLARWRDSLTVCDSSASGYVSTVRSFYSWASDEGLIETNPPVGSRRRRCPAACPDRSRSRTWRGRS
jgi:site-specific recombinase XerD